VDVSPTEGGTVRIDEAIPTEYPSVSTVNNSASVNLEAIPAPGYEFTGWSGSLTGQTNPTTLVMSCTKTITANFSQKIHRLNMQIRGAGSVDPPAGNYNYAEGTVVDITATPDAGCQFDGWTGDVADPSSAITTVTINFDRIVIANFSRAMHTLTLEVDGGGSVIPSEGDYSYVEGTVVDIAAKPDTGYIFQGWTGGVNNAGSASTTVTMDSDKTVVANFSLPKFSLTIGVEGSGSVTPSAGNHSYVEGTVLDITATPEKGYRFAGWTGEVDDANSASTTVTIDSDTSITARFSKSAPAGLIWGGVAVGCVLIIGGVLWSLARKRKPST
jgi:uncharacterized repeat protein (TIGR02543 family)